MRIGFLCGSDPADRSSFSGTAHFAYRALEAERRDGRLDALRVLARYPSSARLARYAAAMRRRVGVAPARSAAATIVDFGEGLDWIVALVSTDLVAGADDSLRAPLALVTDATPGFLRDFYGWPVPPEQDAVEERVIRRAAYCFYSSDYMRERAIADFGADLAPRLKVLPFGVNLERRPEPAPPPPLGEGRPVELLFIGREWLRKGGPIALAVQARLRADGVDARLTIVGCDPAEAQGRPGVVVHPYLDKNRPADARRLDALLDAAHVLLLPTRADCTPMVIAEANAHGMPVMASDVGGIPTLLADGRNGRLMSLEADAEAWTAALRELLADGAAYRALRASSATFCRRTLDWQAWAQGLLSVLSGARNGG